MQERNACEIDLHQKRLARPGIAVVIAWAASVNQRWLKSRRSRGCAFLIVGRCLERLRDNETTNRGVMISYTMVLGSNRDSKGLATANCSVVKGWVRDQIKDVGC